MVNVFIMKSQFNGTSTVSFIAINIFDRNGTNGQCVEMYNALLLNTFGTHNLFINLICGERLLTMNGHSIKSHYRKSDFSA